MKLRQMTFLCAVALAIGVPISGCEQAEPQPEGAGPERMPTATAAISETPEEATPPVTNLATPSPVEATPERAPAATSAGAASGTPEESATPVASPAATPTPV